MWGCVTVTASVLTLGAGDFITNPNYLVPEPSKCEWPKSTGVRGRAAKSQDRVAILGGGDSRSGQAKHAGDNRGSQRAEDTFDCWLINL